MHSSLTINALNCCKFGVCVKEYGPADEDQLPVAECIAPAGRGANFPIRNASATADLQFTANANANLLISGEEKKHTDTEAALISEASAVVTSFDWGAWGELKVIGILPDGSQITGHLINDTSRNFGDVSGEDRIFGIAG